MYREKKNQQSSGDVPGLRELAGSTCVPRVPDLPHTKLVSHFCRNGVYRAVVL